MNRPGLPAGERIKSKADFEKLYRSGSVIISEDKKIKAVYIVNTESGHGNIKIAAVVSSKAGNAVWRNRVKRLMRVSYRLNKENLFNLCLLKKIVLNIIFSPYRLNEKNNRLALTDEILPGMLDVLVKIERSL